MGNCAQYTPCIRPNTTYLAYRLSAVMTLVALGVAGVSGIGFVGLVVCTLLATPLAAVTTLALAAFAENKVQGFALQKAASLFLLPPIAAFFLPPAWQVLFWPLPTYWPTKLYWALQAGEAYWWAYFVGGAVYQAVLVWALLRRFQGSISR